MVKSVLIAFACFLLMGSHAYADDLKKVNVPPGELGAALRLLAKQAGVEFFYRSEQVNGFHTEGVRGVLSPQEAVTKLLAGTPLTVKTDVSGAMVIISARGSDSSQHKGAPTVPKTGNSGNSGAAQRAPGGLRTLQSEDDSKSPSGEP